MRVVRAAGAEYQDILGAYSRYEDFDDQSTEEVFFYGYNVVKRTDLKERYAHYKRKVYLNLEHPCSFFSGSDAVSSLEYFDQVYTICPYTADWLNNRGDTEYIPIIEPFRSLYFTKYEKLDKKKDVIYQGTVHSPALSYLIDNIIPYDYTFVTLQRDGRATHRNIKSQKKWDLIAEAKCSVAMNLLFPAKHQIANVKRYPGWEDNKALSHIDDLGVAPQSKARIVEAAACKTLNLVYKDEWNVIERWFEPDEFVYWETYDQLRILIEDVSKNFDKYIPIIDKAHCKVQQYTVTNFMNFVNEDKG